MYVYIYIYRSIMKFHIFQCLDTRPPRPSLSSEKEHTLQVLL